MPGPTAREGHLDMFLTNFALAYTQSAEKFVADKVFPVVPVQKQSDKYLIYPKGFAFRDEVGPRPLHGSVPIAQQALSQASYIAEEEGLAAMLDDRERENVTPPYDPERAKVADLVGKILIHRDILWAAKFFKPGVWGSDWTGVAAGPAGNQFIQWDQGAADPIAFIDDQRDLILSQTGTEPNVLVMGRKAWRKLKRNAVIKDQLKYTSNTNLTLEIAARLLGVDRVLVPGGIVNMGKEGLADNFQFIVGNNDALLVYASPNPGLEVLTGGTTFRWTGLIPNQDAQIPITRGRADELKHSDWFEGRIAEDQRIVAPDVGVFLSGVVA